MQELVIRDQNRARGSGADKTTFVRGAGRGEASNVAQVVAADCVPRLLKSRSECEKRGCSLSGGVSTARFTNSVSDASRVRSARVLYECAFSTETNTSPRLVDHQAAEVPPAAPHCLGRASHWRTDARPRSVVSWSLSNEPETDAKKEPGALTGCWGGIAPAVHAPQSKHRVGTGESGIGRLPIWNCFI